MQYTLDYCHLFGYDVSFWVFLLLGGSREGEVGRLCIELLSIEKPLNILSTFIQLKLLLSHTIFEILEWVCLNQESTTLI